MIFPGVTKRVFTHSTVSVAQVGGAVRRRYCFAMDNSSSERIGVILDFDGTITTKDTISSLARFSLSFQESRGKQLSEAWSTILAKYSEDYTKHIETYKPAQKDRKTLEEEIKYYRSLREVEQKSFERVSNSGLFKGIQADDWKKFGLNAIEHERVIVRKGFPEFVTGVLKHGGIWGVVSVNFSYEFLGGVLQAAIGVKMSKVAIFANHASKEGLIIGPQVEGNESRNVMATSDTKLLSMKNIAYTWSKGSHSRLIYIGDSGTDIECLTTKGVVGIVMSDDGKSELLKRFARIGITVDHIGVGEVVEVAQTHLYWARNFEEIIDSRLFASITVP